MDTNTKYALGASAISAGAGILGQGISYALNKKLAQYQNDMNMHNWLIQQEYNSPKAQMARLKAAGLNPNLIYGTAANTGNAATAPSSVVPSNPWSVGDILNSALSTGLSTLSSYQDIKKSNQEIEESRSRSTVNDAQARQIEQLILNAKQQGKNMALDNVIKSFDLGERRYLAPYQRKMAEQTLRKAVLDYDKSRQEYEFYNSLNPLRLNEARLKNKNLRLSLRPMEYRNQIIDRFGYDPNLSTLQGGLSFGAKFLDGIITDANNFGHKVDNFVRDTWNSFTGWFGKQFRKLPKPQSVHY